VKLGMTRDWDDIGFEAPLTVLHVPSCQIVQVKTIEGEGKFALQVGAGEVKLKHMTKPMMGHFAKAGTPPKKKLVEFDVSKDCLLPVGTTLYAQHFIPGMKVNVRGTTRGKGFQGVMKRWGFAGQPATHGVSLTHRSLGSTGNRQSPGRVFKGKKMPGRMGGRTRTAIGLTVFKTDPYLNVVFVKGCVPGSKNSWVQIYDTPCQKYINETPPFPTYKPMVGEPVPFEYRIHHDELPAIMRLNDTPTDPNMLLYRRLAKFGPSKEQIDIHKRPQTMADLVKAAIAKRQADKDTIVAKQQQEKQKLKKFIKSAKKKAVDMDEE